MPAPTPFTTVTEALNSLNVSELKALSAHLPDARSRNLKNEIVDEIRHFLDEDQLESLWAKLDKLQKAVVTEVVHSGDFMYDPDRFHAKYGALPNFGSNANPTLLRLFLYNGSMPKTLNASLIQFVPVPEQLKVTGTDAPPTVLLREDEIWDSQTRTSTLETEEIPLTHRDTEAAAQADLVSMLQLVTAGKLRCSEATMAPSAATEKIVAAMLQGGDWYDESQSKGEQEFIMPVMPIKAFGWPMLLQAAGLANLASGKLALSPAGRAALSVRPADTLKSIWKKWLGYRGFDELRRINIIKGQTGRGKQSLTAPVKRRAAITEALANCPVGKWITIEEFWRLIRSNHSFQVTRNEWDLYVSHPEYGSMGSADYSWELLEGRYILCLLFEYAATLGLIDVVYMEPAGAADDYHDLWGADDLEYFSHYDGLKYFRVNPLGAYCVGAALTYTPTIVATRRTLRVLPNHDIVVIEPPLAPGDAVLLDLYALRSSEGVWHLEQAKLLSALDQGHSIEHLRSLLQERAVGELPDTVTRLLEETEQRGKKLRDCGMARLFECTDPHVRTLILHDRRTKSLCYPAGDKHVAVPIEKETAFARAVRELGYIIGR